MSETVLKKKFCDWSKALCHHLDTSFFTQLVFISEWNKARGRREGKYGSLP
jgi:hypothetical protein